MRPSGTLVECWFVSAFLVQSVLVQRYVARLGGWRETVAGWSVEGGGARRTRWAGKGWACWSGSWGFFNFLALQDASAIATEGKSVSLSFEGARGGISRGVAGVTEPWFYPLSQPPPFQSRKMLSPDGGHSLVLGTLTERREGAVG